MGFANSSDAMASLCRLQSFLLWMAVNALFFGTAHQVFNYFVNRMAAISTKLGRQTIFWDEPWTMTELHWTFLLLVKLHRF